MTALDSLAEVNRILEEWDTQNAAAAPGLATFDPVPKLKRLCELIEHETEAYFKMDPDPFDDRHPGRANPQCTLGHLFKAIFKREDFMNKLISHYIMLTRDNAVRTVGTRLLYDILPGLETTVVFQENEGVVDRLLEWAQNADDPLRSYSTGLLASAMDIQDIATSHKERNTILVPLLLQRLHSLQEEMHDEYLKNEANKENKETENERHFSMFAKPDSKVSVKVTDSLANHVHDEGKENTVSEKFSVFKVEKIPGSNSNSSKDEEKTVPEKSSIFGKDSGPKRSYRQIVSDTSNTNIVNSDIIVSCSPKLTDYRQKFIENSATMESCESDESQKSELNVQSRDVVCQLDNIEKTVESNKQGESHRQKDIIDQMDSEGREGKTERKHLIRTDSQDQGCGREQNSEDSLGFLPSGTSDVKEGMKCKRCGKPFKENFVCGCCGNDASNRLTDASAFKDGTDKKNMESKHGRNIEKTPLTHHHYSNVDSGRKREGVTVEERKMKIKRSLSPSYYSEDLQSLKKRRHESTDILALSDYSNSTWTELEPYLIGSFSLEPPLTLGMKQRLILQYLSPMGEYQEFISAAFEHKAMELIFYYINLKYNKDVRLAFEALRYLAVLLCHKKFAIEFLQRGGVKRLLDVYRPSIAATGVSLCLYYLSYFDDAMERVCLLSDHLLEALVSYVLWLMDCSHDSSRCHAAMFFSQAFPFQVILQKFDRHDGLRRLCNVCLLRFDSLSNTSLAVNFATRNAKGTKTLQSFLMVEARDSELKCMGMISMLPIMTVDDTPSSLSDDQIFTMRQAARHVCVALKKYFESHLVLKVRELKQSHLRNEGGSPQPETPPYKPLKLSPEVIQENVELIMELLPVRQQWAPEALFHRLGGMQLLCQLLALSTDWSNYTGKPETLKSALDVIALCCVTPKSQLTLLDSVHMPDGVKLQPIGIPIALADGDVLPDCEVQRAALGVIINCVCGPIERYGGGVGRFMGSGSRKKSNLKAGEDVLSKMWNGVRLNNGIMVLLRLLGLKTPITDADSLRALSCKALAGLARSETVRQIISKLPLFSNGQLQLLMKEPVLQDKRQEHVKFCKYASELLERVSGKESNRYSDTSLEDIRKADIVVQSKIIFREKELLQLIHDHLISKGYTDSAEALCKEARLSSPAPPPSRSIVAGLFPSLEISPTCNAHKPVSDKTPVRPGAPSFMKPQVSAISSSTKAVMTSIPTSTTVAASTVATRPLCRHLSLPGTSPSTDSRHVTASQANPVTLSPTAQINTTITAQGMQSNQNGFLLLTPGTPGPIRFSMKSSQQPVNHLLKQVQTKSKYIREKEVGMSPAIKKTYKILNQKPQTEYEITLDKIVTEYLRKQHGLCRNPVVTCPPMSLFCPHQCPEPRRRISAPVSFPARLARKMIQPRFGGMDGSKLDRKYIYSKFKPVRTFRETEDDGFSCCTFATHEQYLILGTYAGNLKLVNTVSSETALKLYRESTDDNVTQAKLETGSFHCHSSPVTHCEHSRDARLFLTASSYSMMYSSALWSWGNDTLSNLFNFEDHHLEFSNQVQDRLIGTKDETANIYDISTGRRLLRLYDSEQANNYKANRAVFNPTDELVLNDGVLWDARSGLLIHKFDKFNQFVSGVFHPAGLEIIINSEVWDVRNYRLLHTVPALDQCQIRFSHLADVIYATHIDEELDMGDERISPYGSTLRTFDATDYSSIATLDVKSRSIADLCTDSSDCHLAIVENQQQSADIGAEENVCRLYSIGKMKDEDDQNDEEELEEGDDEEEEEEDDDDIHLGDEFDIDPDGDVHIVDAEDDDHDDDHSGDDSGTGDNDDDDDDDDTDDDDDAILSLGSDDDEDDDDLDPDFNIDDVLFELS